VGKDRCLPYRWSIQIDSHILDLAEKACPGQNTLAYMPGASVTKKSLLTLKTVVDVLFYLVLMLSQD